MEYLLVCREIKTKMKQPVKITFHILLLLLQVSLFSLNEVKVADIAVIISTLFSQGRQK